MSLTVPASGEFPVLEREGIAYLDSAATSQTPRSVIEAMDRYYLEARATVHRSTYPLAAEATELFEGARNRVAAFTGRLAGLDHLHAQRDGGLEPRRVVVGPRRTSPPATASR